MCSVSMKYLWFIFALLFLCDCADATNVQFLLTDSQYGISRTTNALITVQAQNIGQNGITLLPLKLQQSTDATGQTTFTNVYGSSISGFYHWTVAVTNSSQRVQGDMWVSSTNLGSVTESFIDIVNGAPTYPSGTWAWSAPASELRYAASTNSAGSFVTIGQLNSTSNSIIAFIVASTNGMTSIVYSNPIALSSFIYSNNPSGYLQSFLTNGLWSGKQPANVILTNLSVTGAFTNQIVAGTNVTLVTNAGIVTIEARNQTSLTNGFVSSSITNGLATTNYVFNATNNLSISNGVMAFEPTNTWATFNDLTNRIAITSNGISIIGISAATATNIFQNGVVGGFVSGVSTNEFLSTSGTNTVNSVSKAAQINSGSRRIGGTTSAFVGISDNDSQNTMLLGGSGNSATGTAQNSGVLNGQANNLNTGLDSTIIGGTSNNIVSVGLTAFSDFIIGSYGLIQDKVGTFIYSDSSLSNVFSATGDNQFLIRATGGVGIITNNPGTNALLIHGSETVNGDVTGLRNLNLSGLPSTYQLTTNIVAIFNAGVSAANGTYTNTGNKIYTNTLGNGSSLNFSGSWVLQTNQVSLYSASSLAAGSVWSDIIGSTTAPNSSYGYTNNFLGQVLANFPGGTSSTTLSNTNTVGSGTHITIVTNAVGNSVVYVVSADTQTNGFFPYTNFVSNITNGLATTNYVINATNNLEVALTNLNYSIYYPTSNPSQFTTIAIATNGIANTNYVNTSDLAVSNGATRVFFFSSTPSNLVTTTSSAVGFSTNGMFWINRNGNSNNWLVLITTNR